MPLDDQATFELLGRGDTLGVFQLDGGPMRDLLRRMQPTVFEDIVAVIALYRPGPMGMNAHNDYADRKNGRQAIKPIHPELEEPLKEILSETYGLIVYQEQIMRIAQKVAGYSLARADILRKAMGKKKREVLEKEYEGFSEGMTGQRVLRAGGQGAVGHHPSVRRLRVQQVARRRLRAGVLLDRLPQGQLPAEYMAGLLTSVGDDKDKAAVYLADCRRLGITVLPPDVNESELNFASVGSDIRFGLGAVRNVGANVVASLINTRNDKGKYTDFSDYLNKIDIAACNKKVDGVADQGGRVRLPRPPAQGPVPGAHRCRRLGARHQEGRGDGSVRPVRRLGRRGHRWTPCSPSRCPTRNGTTNTSSPWSARCWGSTCPGIHSTASRICWPPRSTRPSRPSWTAMSPTTPRSGSAASWRR